MKILLGIASGSALIGIGYWWGAADQQAVSGETLQSTITQETAIEGDSIFASTTIASDRNEAQVPREPHQVTSRNIDSDATISFTPSPSIPNPAGGEQTDTPTSKKIPLSAETNKTLGEGEPAELHRKLEHSDRDDSWSPYMEAQLRGYLSQKQSLSVFTFPVIECRVAGCEIQGIGYVENANQIWVNATSDIYTQPWFEFKDMSTSVSQIGGNQNINGIVIILLKEPRN